MKKSLFLLSCAWLAGFAQSPSAPISTASDPVLIRKVEAEYTPEARSSKLQGTVYLYVEISPEGKPEHVQVMHGLGLGLDEKAVEAVKQWRFTPGTKDRQPERVAQSVEVQFRLENAGPWSVRQAAYTIGGKPSEVILKPVLSRYASPNFAACPADGGNVIVETSIGKNGLPSGIQPRGSDDPMTVAAAKAIGSWRFQPGKVAGERREVAARFELECSPPPGAIWNPQVYSQGNGVSGLAVVYKREAEYSKEARDARYNGEVALKLVIDSTGRPAQLRIVKMLGMGLDEKALEAVSQWRFKPATKDGHPVNVGAYVEVSFRYI
jgi:TonB family protein